VVDVGAGDGKLAAWLAAHGHRVIATENRPGPLTAVRRLLDPLGIESRLGAGLEPLAPGEAEVAVIAGLGGRSIAAILASSPAVVARLRALVLQPVQHESDLRRELERQGFRIEAEAAIEQGRRRYLALRVLPPYSTGS
jgi:tRNA (adenine22-N1)-methyltransferase